MAVINTNIAATITSNALAKNERAMGQTMERLSTGQRINSAADDAAGLAISSKLTSQVRGLDQAVRNGNDAISMIQTADGAMVEVTNMLQRMRELAVQAASGTNGSADRASLQTEFAALASQINTVGNDTSWNGVNILDTTATTANFQIGANAGQTVSHTFAQIETGAVGTLGTVPSISSGAYNSINPDTGTDAFLVGDTLSFTIDSVAFNAEITAVASNGTIAGITMHGASSQIAAGGSGVIATHATGGDITLSLASGGATFSLASAVTTASWTLANVSITRGLVAGSQSGDISTQGGATNAIKSLDHMLDKVNTARASAGAVINRLEYAVDNLANVSQNTAASRSRILDADYASESTELARTQIIQQAGTAMLAQANQQAQSVLALLK